MAEVLETDKKVQLLFDDILAHFSKAKEEDVMLVKKAFALAMEAHKGVNRKSGEPFICHPLEVAKIVIEEMGLGTKAVAAAMLHDVVEDSSYTIDDIRREFGDKIAIIVDGLTKITGAFNEHVSLQAENFRKILLAMVSDMRVILIKLADRLHNMRTLESLSREKQMRFAGETIYLYAPLAHRLGLYSIKTEMENLSLKYRFPEIYKELKNKMENKEQTRQYYINNFIQPLLPKLAENNFKVEIVRPKMSIYSIWFRMQQEHISFEEAYDLIRLDIIFAPIAGVPEKFQCWNIYSLITDFFMPKPEFIRDFVTKPKANGYEALHATFMGPNGKWVEIHIKTQRMHDIAERGIGAYFSYRRENPIEASEIDKWIDRVKEMLESPEEDALEFLDNFKLNLFSSEIMVFTPKGHLKVMSNDATVLDFAYEIHSEIGNKALAAKVNHRLVPLNYKLKGGDQVEILTSDKITAVYEWLDIVKTAKAKASIKKVLSSSIYNKIKKGQELLEQKLAELNIVADNELFKKLFPAYNVHNKYELYSKIGSGIISFKNLESIIRKEQRKKTIRYWKLQLSKSLNRKNQNAKDKKKPIMLTENIAEEEQKYKRATCCNPIPGDEVIGHSTPNEKIIIHKSNCPNAIKIMSRHANLIVPVTWTAHKIISFPVRIAIEGIDSFSVYNDITSTISNELNVKIRSIKIDSNEGIIFGAIDLYVHDTKDLNTLIMKIMKIKAIESVKRIDFSEEENYFERNDYF